MKTLLKVGFTMLTALLVPALAEDLVITGFSGAGELSFKDVHATGSYTIEWSSSLDQTNWSSDWSKLSQVQATGGTIRVKVPTFFRVRHNPEAPVAIPETAPVQAPPTSAGSSVEPTRVTPAPLKTFDVPLADTRDTGFNGGSGSLADPYRITSADQLQNIGNSLASHYVLLNDINISSTAGWDGGKGFRPIGNLAKPFSGVFDGRGHTITGLRIARFGVVTTDIALFGATSTEAWIGNVSVLDAVVAGCDFVGILAGRNQGTITNCHVAGIVSGSGSFGGLVGANIEHGLLTRCSATVGVGPLWAGNHLGGLTGGNYKGTIRDCFAVGVVKGSEDPGGLVGVNGGGTIERCYACVDVESTFDGYRESYHRGAGGLVALTQLGGVIRDCFAVGKVKGPANLPTGLLVGVVDIEATVLNSYTLAAGTGSYEGIGKIFPNTGKVECSPVKTIDAAFFSGETGPLKSWDFTRTWSLEANDKGYAYPRFR